MKDKKFITLPLLDYLISVSRLNGTTVSNVAIISVQHLLETTGSMFESFMELGIPANQIFVIGKLYSNDKRTSNKLNNIGITVLPSSDSNKLGIYYDLLEKDSNLLWKRFLNSIDKKDVDTIIVLDDGGMLVKTTPLGIEKEYKVIGIEQTSSGIKFNEGQLRIPVINVARSLVKTQIEPSFISQAVIQKTRMKLVTYRPNNIGIIGFGAIGKGLFNDLKENYNINVYDSNKEIKVNNSVNSLNQLYHSSDLIIGATGKDVSFTPILDEIGSNKVLMSVSSGDIEFNSLLREIQKRNGYEVNSILDNIYYNTNDNKKISILRGGTPVNFDNNIHSVFPEYIQLTRALLLLAVIEAIRNVDDFSSKKKLIQLSVKGQIRILKEFISLKNLNLGNFKFQTPIEKLIEEETY